LTGFLAPILPADERLRKSLSTARDAAGERTKPRSPRASQKASRAREWAFAATRNRDASVRSMNDLSSLTDSDLLTATRALVCNSCEVEADLLAHLGEIDARRLYLERAHSSMFAFCTRELGFSEGAAYNRILVARAARKLPAMLAAVRSGRVHLTGLRLLAPHLTQENCEQLLAKATGRTKDEIAELVAALAPRPAPATRALLHVRLLPLPTRPSKCNSQSRANSATKSARRRTCCATAFRTATSPRSFAPRCNCSSPT
jgi:hypothetical protein